jgi:hypothetical protein
MPCVTLSRATEADAQVLLDKTQKTMADFLLAQSPVNATTDYESDGNKSD